MVGVLQAAARPVAPAAAAVGAERDPVGDAAQVGQGEDHPERVGEPRPAARPEAPAGPTEDRRARGLGRGAGQQRRWHRSGRGQVGGVEHGRDVEILHPRAPERVGGVGRPARVRGVGEVPPGGAREQRRAKAAARSPPTTPSRNSWSGTVGRSSPRSRSARFLSSQKSSASTRKSSVPAVQAPVAAAPPSASPNRKRPPRAGRGVGAAAPRRRPRRIPFRLRACRLPRGPVRPGTFRPFTERRYPRPRRLDCALGHCGGRGAAAPFCASAAHVTPLGPVALLRPPPAERAEQRARAAARRRLAPVRRGAPSPSSVPASCGGRHRGFLRNCRDAPSPDHRRSADTPKLPTAAAVGGVLAHASASPPAPEELPITKITIPRMYADVMQRTSILALPVVEYVPKPGIVRC